MVAFLDLTKQVHIIKDLILSDMVYEDDHIEETAAFNTHIYCTKFWYLRLSWANKKRFLLTLVDDIKSGNTISTILKSIWNARTKDTVLSTSTPKILCSYDLVPMDNNRTALPLSMLVQVMKSDRKWFVGLDPELQSTVILELLTISGGPLVWEVLKRANKIYERHWHSQLSRIKQLSLLAVDSVDSGGGDKKPKKSIAGRKSSILSANRSSKMLRSSSKLEAPGHAKSTAAVELETRLAAWKDSVQAMRDKLKMEEVIMVASDGTQNKIWKVNRPITEAVETLDSMQLLPASIAKYILSFLPTENYGDYAKVNKYWAYLIDELKAEVALRQKIQIEMEKFNDILMQNDTSMEMLGQVEPITEIRIDQRSSAQHSGTMASVFKSFHRPPGPPSTKLSEKSANYSLRHFAALQQTQKKSPVRPIPNLAELTERLERRGAADDDVFQWCQNLLLRGHDVQEKGGSKRVDGVIDTGLEHFPCPLLRKTIEIPLEPPLVTDPAINFNAKSRKNIASSTLMHTPRCDSEKRYKLWSRDFTGLYPVTKMMSHDAPK